MLCRKRSVDTLCRVQHIEATCLPATPLRYYTLGQVDKSCIQRTLQLDQYRQPTPWILYEDDAQQR